MGTITVNTKELHDRLYFTAKSFGGCPSAFDCYMALRGLKTLKLRMVPLTNNLLMNKLLKRNNIVKVL